MIIRVYNVARVSPTFKPAAGTDMPDMDMGMSRIRMMSSVSVPVVSVSVYPACFTYPCQTLTVDCRWDNGGFWFQEVEYVSVLPLFCLLISFFLCSFADFRSPMTFFKIGNTDCTTIYTVITIWTHCV